MCLSKVWKNHRRKVVILGLIVLAWLVMGPTAKWLWPSHWWGTSLIVLMNENEARPCGGFVTAYGTLRLPLFKAELHNSFAFPPVNLGENTQPLRQVSVERKFWDLGDQLDPTRCASQFAEAYQQAEGQVPNRVIIVHSVVIERWLAALGAVQAGESHLTSDNFFALTSRLVADVDRHDEGALSERKGPLAIFGKSIIRTTLLRPWRWPKVTRALGNAEEQGTLYFHRLGTSSPSDWSQKGERFMAVTEWNLGGGKSSRYLEKQWTIKLDQRTPDLWDGVITLDVQHLGGYDVPLSQTWQGGFELFVWGASAEFIPAEIEPGGEFSHDFVFSMSSAALLQTSKAWRGLADFWLYTPPSQDWRTALHVRALGQQRVISLNDYLDTKENTAVWHGTIEPSGKNFRFNVVADKTPPFLVWHKPIDASLLKEDQLSTLGYEPGDVIIELQFNEPIKHFPGAVLEAIYSYELIELTEAEVRLKDRNYAVKNITDDLLPSRAIVLAGRQTVLLKVRPDQYQTNERYYLQIDGVQDRWGNEANIRDRTVITR